MSERFHRVGMGYHFSPSEAPLVLKFSHPERDQSTWEVVVTRRDGGHLITRRINLLAGTTRGNVKDLIDELTSDGIGDPKLLARLLREACESVLASHRNGRPFLRLQGHVERPPEPAWLCQGLLLKGKPNCWLGASSTGKSTLAKAICADYAAGFRFCEREMEQGVPLYLDWEDDFESFTRTVLDVCANLGVRSLPYMMWRDMHGYRLRNQVEAISEAIDREGVGLLVLDAVAAAGGATGEHMTWEAVALEMEECLGSLPPVTVLALDHVTGAEHQAGRRDGKRAAVPIKARGAERKLEYLRNQWSLVTDEEAVDVGRHVVNWHHTKNSVGPKERPGFATEIMHRPREISIVTRPLPGEPSGAEAEDATDTERILASLAEAINQTPREVAWRVDKRQPDARREDSVRRMLDRLVLRGLATKGGKRPLRYSPVSGQVGPERASEGLWTPFRDLLSEVDFDPQNDSGHRTVP